MANFLRDALSAKSGPSSLTSTGSCKETASQLRSKEASTILNQEKLLCEHAVI